MKGVVPYFGGKSRVTKTTINKIPEHTCYVEMFAGGASVFFTKPPSPAEVINDLDKDLVTLYRAVKHHPEELYRQFKFSLVSRAEFEREKEVNPETLTDIQRAARYLYLQKSAFGGHITGQTFGMSTTGKPRLNLLTLENTIEEAWKRLVLVVIKCKDFPISFRDTIGCIRSSFSTRRIGRFLAINSISPSRIFFELRDVLQSIDGKFLMTINDIPQINEIFSPFSIEETTLKYSCCSSTQVRAKVRTELLIMNY